MGLELELELERGWPGRAGGGRDDGTDWQIDRCAVRREKGGLRGGSGRYVRYLALPLGLERERYLSLLWGRVMVLGTWCTDSPEARSRSHTRHLSYTYTTYL